MFFNKKKQESVYDDVSYDENKDTDDEKVEAEVGFDDYINKEERREEPRADKEYQDSVETFKRLNNDQLESEESRSGMKSQKTKSFFSGAMRKFASFKANASDTVKSAVKDGNWSMKGSYSTDNEKKQVGLSKRHIMLGMAVICVIVFGGFYMMDGSDEAPKKTDNAPVLDQSGKVTNPKSYSEKALSSDSNINIPTRYSQVKKDVEDSKNKDSKNKDMDKKQEEARPAEVRTPAARTPDREAPKAVISARPEQRERTVKKTVNPEIEAMNKAHQSNITFFKTNGR